MRQSNKQGGQTYGKGQNLQGAMMGQSMKQKVVPGSSVGVPVISRPQLNANKLQSGATLGNGGKTAGLLGSAPGSIQQISANDVRKMRQEILNLRNANQELKDELHETR